MNYLGSNRDVDDPRARIWHALAFHGILDMERLRGPLDVQRSHRLLRNRIRVRRNDDVYSSYLKERLSISSGDKSALLALIMCQD